MNYIFHVFEALADSQKTRFFSTEWLELHLFFYTLFSI